MAALDTNVLVRYLVQDDEKQFASAKKLVAAALRDGEALYVPLTVTLELEWVLRSKYGFDKEQVSMIFASLLSAFELAFESERVVEIALALFKSNATDFADCIHIASTHAAGESPLWTFDRAASKVEGAKLLTTP
jgi:predicted nucleic-acid-binding protein